MPSTVYQDVVNLIVGRHPVYLWMLRCRNIVLLAVTVLDVAKFATRDTEDAEAIGRHGPGNTTRSDVICL
jgi:hypothetical protein